MTANDALAIWCQTCSVVSRGAIGRAPSPAAGWGTSWPAVPRPACRCWLAITMVAPPDCTSDNGARPSLPSSSGSLPVLVEANGRGRSGPLTDPKQQHPCTHPTAGAPRRVEQPAVVLTEQTASVHLCEVGSHRSRRSGRHRSRRRLDQRSLASAWFLLLGARSGALAISQTAVQGCVLEPLCARDAPKQPRPRRGTCSPACCPKANTTSGSR